MDAKSFYSMWDKSLESNEQMVPLQVFDDEPTEDNLIDLLLDTDDVEDSGVATVEPAVSDIVAPASSSVGNAGIFAFVKAIPETPAPSKVVQVNPLYDAIQEFCNQYDYDFSDGIISCCYDMTSRECSIEDAYCEILRYLFDIVVDCTFDSSLLQYSFADIEDIMPVYRNLYLSELLTIVSYKNTNSFDAAVIKYFSLEKRDTGLLLQLMNAGQFDREEALSYTIDLDMFNSYLVLKASDKFDKELFNSINLVEGNLNGYTKSVLSDSPWAFLASNPNFSEILEIVEENDVPLDLAVAYEDNKWIYQIIKAYAKGLFSREFIEVYLCEENSFADYMADYYADGKLSSSALEVYDGNFYVAKFIYDVTEIKDDCELFLSQAINNEASSAIIGFSTLTLNAIFRGELLQSEWYKFINVIGTQNSIDLLKAYCLLSKDSALTFNQFCFKMLTKALGLEVAVPNDIGSLLLFQRGVGLSYTNTQMIAVCFEKLVDSLKRNLTNGQYACVLPAKTGLLVCQPDYNNFAAEEEKFKVFARCQSSLDRAVADDVAENVMKYNIQRILNSIQSSGYSEVSDSFKSLMNSPLETYLLFDDLLDVIASKLTEFIGLCRSASAISLIKYLNSVICHTNKAVIQIEFLKTVLKKFFGNRISFERYNPNGVLPITVIEVQNSATFSSESFRGVMYRFDDFVNDLNRKNKIICRFSELSKIVITGV